MLGDTAVAVHPDDPRYQALVGKIVELPLTGRTIPIVADDYVDMQFGSGAVKVTPAHDPNDFEIGKRHDLPLINILNPDDTLNDNVPEAYRGLKVKEARAQGRRGHQAGGAVRQGGEAPPRGGALLPLPLGHRALPVRPVVRAHAPAGRQGPGRLGARGGALLPEEVGEHLRPLAAQHPRLVHLPPAVVGAPHPGLVLRRLRPDDRGPGGPDGLRPLRQHGHPPGPGRAGHLVLLLALALLHPGLAGGHRGPAGLLSRPRCWSPPTRSSSSGWRA